MERKGEHVVVYEEGHAERIEAEAALREVLEELAPLDLSVRQRHAAVRENLTQPIPGSEPSLVETPVVAAIVRHDRFIEAFVRSYAIFLNQDVPGRRPPVGQHAVEGPLPIPVDGGAVDQVRQ